ncbi:MAG: acyl carrier protein [Proteobacteria bacterium]|nr:acyl carrier protein [Pseudomonadota bacterium]
MTDRERLKALLIDTFLLDPEEFSFDLRRAQVDTWDSLGVVSLAVGVEQTFGYHLTPEEAMSLDGVPALVAILQREGISCGG